MRAATDLFTPEGKDYWMLSGTRIHNGEMEKEYSFSIHTLKNNDLIGVQVTCDGNLNYFVNGVNQGTAMSGIPSKKEIFGVFDVYGRTKQVSIKYFGGVYMMISTFMKLIACENSQHFSISLIVSVPNVI